MDPKEHCQTLRLGGGTVVILCEAKTTDTMVRVDLMAQLQILLYTYETVSTHCVDTGLYLENVLLQLLSVLNTSLLAEKSNLLRL